MPLARLTQFDFHHTLAETEGISLVFFTAPGCGACRQLKKVLESHPREFALHHVFEVDAQQDMALTREFEVFHLPAMFLFKDGHYHAAIHAEPQSPSIIAAIDAALAGAPQEAP